jgi:phosphotransferase system  glucose/maltose/N-acetylglucosamine-specific IIC component
MKQIPGSGKREFYLVLALLLVITLFLVISISREIEAPASGAPHPEISGMQIGGDGAARIKGIEAAAFVLFSATFILLSVLVVASVSKRNRTPVFWGWTGLITLTVLYVWYRVFDSYLDYLRTGDLIYILGFPEPTAWMIFGLWGGGAMFSFIYVIGFRRFVYSPEDEQTLKEILEEYNSEREED